MLKVVIIGKANVGKSTLYNKLVKQKKSIVYDKPGVTRDVLESTVSIGEYKFNIYDTAGFEDQIFFSTDYVETILKEAQIILFVVADSVDKSDHDLLHLIRKSNISQKKITLIINKCDVKKYDYTPFLELGLDNYIITSAEHSIGIYEINRLIYNLCCEYYTESNISDINDVKKDQIRLAIIGQPNVGKSTFVNNILKANRMITKDEPGTTRDSVEVNFMYDNTKFILVDTPGIRRKSRITNTLEKFSTYTSISTMKNADIVLYLFESASGIEKQDFILINNILKNGKTIIMGANKYDVVKKNKKDKAIREEIDYQCNKNLYNNVPVVYFSALKDSQCGSILSVSKILHKHGQRKISTAKLNKWLNYACTKHAHPLIKKKVHLKLKYIVQSGNNPLYFKIHCNYPNNIIKSYVSYLEKSLREYFKIEGIPIFLTFIKSHNPYINNNH